MKHWLAAIALTALGVGSVQAAPSSPATFNLRLSDLPPGFTQVTNWTKGNAAAAAFARESVKKLNAQGRLLTADAFYSRIDSTGERAIVSELVSYKSSAAAKADFTRLWKLNLKMKGTKAVLVGSVGDERGAITEIVPGSGPAYSAAGVQFRRGAYDELVVVLDSAESPALTEALTLARVIDGRIKAHG